MESVGIDPPPDILTIPEEPLKGERPGYTCIFNLDGRFWFYSLAEQGWISDMDCLGHSRVKTLAGNSRVTLDRSEILFKVAELSATFSFLAPLPVDAAVILKTKKGHVIDNSGDMACHHDIRFFVAAMTMSCSFNDRSHVSRIIWMNKGVA